MIKTVKVTQEHIASGMIEDCHYCPNALGIVDLLLPNVVCQVNTSYAMFKSTVNISLKGLAWMPFAARKFLERFDKGEAVEPYEFLLSIPDWALKPSELTT